MKRIKIGVDLGDDPTRALASFKHFPFPVPPGIDLDSTRFTSGIGVPWYRPFSVHTEAVDPSILDVGRPTSVSTRTLRLREIDPGATWVRTPTEWDRSDETRVDLGDRNEEALTGIGGEPTDT
ncbi:MAG: hypothetical protein ACRDY1_03790 [Acidimicrobiales bacterium]